MTNVLLSTVYIRPLKPDDTRLNHAPVLAQQGQDPPQASPKAGRRQLGHKRRRARHAHHVRAGGDRRRARR